MKCPHCGKETAGKKEIDLSKALKAFHTSYPCRGGGQRWPEAERNFASLVKGGIDPVDLVAKALAYRQYCDVTKRVGTEYVMQAATWLGRGGGWMEPWERLALTEPALRFDQARRQLQEQT